MGKLHATAASIWISPLVDDASPASTHSWTSAVVIEPSEKAAVSDCCV